MQAWNFIIVGARPFFLSKQHFRISHGNIFKGQQDQGQVIASLVSKKLYAHEMQMHIFPSSTKHVFRF